MAVEITGKYLGALRVEMTHGPSGALLQTVAPTDNQGDGSCFSPTDLVAAALGSRMMTLMGIVAQRDGSTFPAHISASSNTCRRPRRAVWHPYPSPFTCRVTFQPSPSQTRTCGPDLPRSPQPAPGH